MKYIWFLVICGNYEWKRVLPMLFQSCGLGFEMFLNYHNINLFIVF